MLELSALPRLAAVLAAALAAGCGPDDEPDDEPAVCPACAAPVRAGALAHDKLDELSGLAASADRPDVYYAHNDAGDSSRFFALSRAGADLGTYKVKDAQNIDWEDMERGPCPGGSCLYIADIGDNERERLAYTLYRLAEPAVIGPGERELAAERFVFTYPDGAHDAETLLVHPVTGEVTIVTKIGSGPAPVFALPLPLTASMTLMAARVGEVRPPSGDRKFTGGSVHPDGSAVLMRTNTSLFYYPMRPEQTVAEALAGAPCELPVADEDRGEAVTWSADGAEILTIGEGVGAQINASSCAPGQP